jgi:predicted nucleic acid-binding protein
LNKNNVVVVDTGPLVAYLVATDTHHDWATDHIKRLRPPLLTCEPVLAESCYIAWQLGEDPAKVLDLLSRGMIGVAFQAEDHVEELADLMRRYNNLPMSLADACLVRMAETREKSVVFTVDSHFRIYRKHGRHVIPTLLPPQ